MNEQPSDSSDINCPQDGPLTAPTLTQSTPASLQTIPVDIVFELSSWLPQSSRLSLSYTCKRYRVFYHDTGFFVEVLFGRQRSSENYAEIRSEQLAYHHILERHRPRQPNRPSSRAICSSCQTRHFVRDFDPEELAKSAEIRLCKGASRRFWICSHNVLDYNQLASLHESSLHIRDTPGASRLCDDDRHRLNMIGSGIYMQWHLGGVIVDEVLPREKVQEMLACFKGYVCPHWRPDTVQLENPFPCQHHRIPGPNGHDFCIDCSLRSPGFLGCGVCRACEVTALLEICPDRRLDLVVWVTRGSNKVYGVNDPKWFQYSKSPAEVEHLRILELENEMRTEPAPTSS